MYLEGYNYIGHGFLKKIGIFLRENNPLPSLGG